MAGGEGSLRRCTAKSVEAAADAGPQASLRGCSTKRKAGKEAASGRSRATGRKAKQGDAAASAGKEAEKAAAGVKNRLSAKEIKWILSQKPSNPPPRYAALKRSNRELVPLPGEEDDEDKMSLYYVTRAFYKMEDQKPKLKNWVLSELKTKGYVEVDDEHDKRKAEAQAQIDRAWPEIEAMIKRIDLLEGKGEEDKEIQSDSSDEEEEDR